MADIDRDEWLNRQVRELRLAYDFETIPGARWGEIIVPETDTNPKKTGDGLRVLLVLSFPNGYITFKTARAFEIHYPDDLNSVALITDDPANPDARINVKHRGWHDMSENERHRVECETVTAALDFGLPVYTGDIKSEAFLDQIRDWRVEVILCCGFGQLLPDELLSIPRLGAYNLHPADLRHGFGAGPAPYDDAVSRGIETSRWTLHVMTRNIDSGPVVGVSPPVNVRLADGSFPENPVRYYCKMSDAVDHMVYHILSTLVDLVRNPEANHLSHVDFTSLFSSDKKQELMRPIGDGPFQPIPDGRLFTTPRKP